jgi:outer membrane lipoprotein LolB
MSAVRVAACVLVAAVLASCRTVPPRSVSGPGADAPWPQQRAALDKLDRYALNGRVAVAANGQGFSASLRYTQAADRTQFSLEGPLGIGGLRVDAQGERLQVATSRGEKLDGPEARAELERRLGFALPLDELRWWLLGVPAPGESTVNATDTGEIRDFAQNGWRVNINSRAPGIGFSLPQRLTVQRVEGPDQSQGQGNGNGNGSGSGARIKLLVERWE